MPLFTHMKTGDWKEYVIVSSIRTSVGGRVWINLNLSGSKAHTLLHAIFFYPFYLGEEEKKKEWNFIGNFGQKPESRFSKIVQLLLLLYFNFSFWYKHLT